MRVSSCCLTGRSDRSTQSVSEEVSSDRIIARASSTAASARGTCTQPLANCSTKASSTQSSNMNSAPIIESFITDSDWCRLFLDASLTKLYIRPRRSGEGQEINY